MYKIDAVAIKAGFSLTSTNCTLSRVSIELKIVMRYVFMVLFHVRCQARSRTAFWLGGAITDAKRKKLNHLEGQSPKRATIKGKFRAGEGPMFPLAPSLRAGLYVYRLTHVIPKNLSCSNYTRT